MKSNPATDLSGTTKGSVLEPILFVIYINDLPEVMKCHTYLFADDIKNSLTNKHQRKRLLAASRYEFIEGIVLEMDSYISPKKVSCLKTL